MYSLQKKNWPGYCVCNLNTSFFKTRTLMRQYCILKNITNTIMVITIRTADMAHVCCNSGNRCKWNFLKKITFHKWDYIPLLQHSIQVTEIARNKTCSQILIQVKYRWSFLRFKTCNDCKRISNRNNNTV